MCVTPFLFFTWNIYIWLLVGINVCFKHWCLAKIRPWTAIHLKSHYICIVKILYSTGRKQNVINIFAHNSQVARQAAEQTVNLPVVWDQVKLTWYYSNNFMAENLNPTQVRSFNKSVPISPEKEPWEIMHMAVLTKIFW